MEFNVSLADLFPGEISVVHQDLIPLGCPGLNKLGSQRVREHVAEILDVMGKASAAAQNLHQIITNAQKLRDSSGEQKVYLLCDLEANLMIGLLKIGHKKLFVFDTAGTQHEMNPLCILDFYVHESRQRMGCGKHLFEHMLHQEQAQVAHLAVDRPSDKFLFFFRKHYGLTQIIPQVNNFVVFDGFFASRSDYAGKKKRWGGLDQVESPPDHLRKKVGYTQLEDSNNYNSQPGLFLRNPGAGSLPSYSHIPHRHSSSIGNILQPSPMHGPPVHRSPNNITPSYQRIGVGDQYNYSAQFDQRHRLNSAESVRRRQIHRQYSNSHSALW